jgi:hypothetical protein
MPIYKERVTSVGVREEISRFFPDLDRIYASFGQQCIITCTTEGHPELDPHTHGFAIDMRTKDIAQGKAERIYLAIRDLVGPTYTVLFESIGSQNEHIHLQLRKDIWRSIVYGQVPNA